MNESPTVFQAAAGSDCVWLMAAGRSRLYRVDLPSMECSEVASLNVHPISPDSSDWSPIGDLQFLLCSGHWLWAPGPNRWLQAVDTDRGSHWELNMPFAVSSWACNEAALFAAVSNTGQLARVDRDGHIQTSKVGEALSRVVVNEEHVWLTDVGTGSIIECSASTLRTRRVAHLDSELISSRLLTGAHGLLLASGHALATFSWTTGLSSAVPATFDGVPVMAGEQVLLTKHNFRRGTSHITARSAKTLEIEWEIPMPEQIMWLGVVGSDLVVLERPRAPQLSVYQRGARVCQLDLRDLSWGRAAATRIQTPSEIVTELPRAVRRALESEWKSRDSAVEDQPSGHWGWQRNLSIDKVRASQRLLILTFRWKDDSRTYELRAPYDDSNTTADDLASELVIALMEEFETGFIPGNSSGTSASGCVPLRLPYTLGRWTR